MSETRLRNEVAFAKTWLEGSSCWCQEGSAMRRLILLSILCLTATPAFACVLDTDCAKKPGTICVDGDCIGVSVGDSDDSDDARDKPATGKTCSNDSDCSQRFSLHQGLRLQGCLHRSLKRHLKKNGAPGRTRTSTPLRATDFESAASTIPPLGLRREHGIS
jgi:hypothetical protein